MSGTSELYRKSKVAIFVPSQWMDHLGISSTVDRRGAFRVAGVTTADVSSFSGFRVWYGKRQLRKLATKIFHLSVQFWVYASNSDYQYRK